MKRDIGWTKLRRRVIARSLADENSVNLRGKAGIKAVETAGGCSGKERFPDYGAAARVIMRKKGKRHGARQAYACKSCGGWHLGGHL
jgi:hypothetical protein